LSFVVVVHYVSGITCLDNKLYVVYWSSHTIRVFTSDSLSKVSVITVAGLQDPEDIVACRDDHQLYVIDIHSFIMRVSAMNPSDQEMWLTGDSEVYGFHTLSLRSRRLLVTSPQSGSLRQYSTTNRQLLRVIKFPDSVVVLNHAVETTRGTFVICHGEPSSAVSELFSFISC